MTLPPFHGPRREAVALLALGMFLLAGCGADGTAASEAARAPATASTTDQDEQRPPEGATASPGPGSTGTASASSPTPTATSTPAAEGGGGGTVSAAPQAPAEEYVITIVDFAYEVPATVPPGATITVVNDDSAAHTVTSRGNFDVAVTTGASATFTAPEEPGEYTITCLYHGNMTATLVVG